MMQKYKDFRPTAFDHKGLLGEYHGISEFLVVPVSHTRDSGSLDESNFYAALEMLGGESEDVQVHRFGHWGPGWFEIILVNPDKPELVAIAESIESSIEDYPVLDDEDLSSREWEDAESYWQNMSIRERIKELSSANESIFAARSESLSELGDRAPTTYQHVYDRSISNY